ncbi:uncharacterized protein [Anoplolepis gracilipes]|uniref:uncharacterized protein n=1 Tax=Anoplolepis gracilipes TaxID=354296 RepID=UPI003BA11195
MKLVYIVLIIICRTSTESETCDSTEIKNWNVNLNKLMDDFNPSIVQIVRKYGLDPLELPQTAQTLRMENPNFSESTVYKIDLVLKSGILKGLSNLERHNNATLTYANKLLKMDIGFEFEHLQGTYDYMLKLIFRNEGRIIATAKNVRAIINIIFNTRNYTLVLNKFDLQVPGRIKVTVENKKGSVDWINTAIVNIVTPFFKETITDAVRKEASNAIQTYFNEINHKIAPPKTLTRTLEYKLLDHSLTNVHQNLVF